MQPLDHIADGTKFNSINLTFNFTAVDSDGDPATGTLTVTVDDTSPVITGTIFDQTLNEQALPDGNHVNGDTVTATASLGIDWGADNEIVTSVGGFGRTLAFLAGDNSTAIAGGSATRFQVLRLSIAGEQGIRLELRRRRAGLYRHCQCQWRRDPDGISGVDLGQRDLHAVARPDGQ